MSNVFVKNYTPEQLALAIKIADDYYELCKSLETEPTFLGYVKSMRDSLATTTTSEELHSYQAIFFNGKIIWTDVTKEQLDCIENFVQSSKRNGVDLDTADYNIITNIVAQIPPSRRSTYHEHDFVAAAEYYFRHPSTL